MQHFLEKWDSYLGKLLGIAIVIVTLTKTENLVVLSFFRYFLFLMIGVAVFDIIVNFGQHESHFWRFAAVLSNLFTVASCLVMLQLVLGVSLPVQIPDFFIFHISNFMLYLGIFIFIENSLWTYVYDHI